MLNTHYPNVTDLSEDYRQLEGFTELELACRTDISKADLNVLTTADVHREVKRRPGDSLKDVLVTFSVIFGLLLTSSVTLGLATSQLTNMVKQLHQETNRGLDNLNRPTVWRL